MKKIILLLFIILLISIVTHAETPVNGATGVSVTTNFAFSAVTVPPTTHLQVSVTNAFNPGDLVLDVNLSNGQSSYTFNAADLIGPLLGQSNLDYNTTYYWRIFDTDGSNVVEPSAAPFYYSFTTFAFPTTPNPANGAVGIGVIHNFTWTWSGSTANHIRFSFDPGMASPTVYTITPAANSFTNVTPLENGVTYYWQVSADGGTTWYPSTPWSFTTIGPAVPYLQTPANNSVTGDQLITFSWFTGMAGLQYTLEISTTSDMQNLVPAATTTTTNPYVTLNTSIFNTGTDYYWRVTSKTMGGVIINYSNVWKFSIAGLPQPIASYPTNGLSVYNNPPGLCWYLLNYNSKVTSFRVKYSTTSGSYTVPLGTTNATEGYFDTGNPNWFTTIPTALTSGQTYYWKVASCDGTSESAYSLEESFTVYGTLTSLVCYPSYPILGAVVDAQPTFYWYTNVYAPVLYFRLEIDDDPGFGSINLTVNNIPGTSYTLTSSDLTTLNPTLGGTYYWRVSGGFAMNTFGTPSTPASFVYPTTVTTAASVPVPTLISPILGQVVSVTNPTLTWTIFHSNPLKFQVIYSTDPSTTGGVLDNPIVPISSTPWVNGTSYLITGLIPGATYYWQVRARDEVTLNISAWSSIGYFTVSPGASSVVPLAGSPINGYPINSTIARVFWVIPAPSESKLTYDFEYADNKDFKNAIKMTGLTTNSITLEGLEKNKTYYWRVASRTDKGDISAYSAPAVFNTGNVVSVKEKSLPNSFELYQNYPNPFNPSTIIKYSIPRNTFVTLKIYDMLGREIKTLINNEVTSGTHSIVWDGFDNNGNKVASGIYIYRLIADGFNTSKKMMLIK